MQLRFPGLVITVPTSVASGLVGLRWAQVAWCVVFTLAKNLSDENHQLAFI